MRVGFRGGDGAVAAEVGAAGLAIVVVVFDPAGVVVVSMLFVVVVSVLVVVDVVVVLVVVGALVVGSVVVGGGSARAAAAATPLPKTTTVATVITSLFKTMTPDYRPVRSGAPADRGARARGRRAELKRHRMDPEANPCPQAVAGR